MAFDIEPNRAALQSRFGVTVTRGGKPVRNADVTARFVMLDMQMDEQSFALKEQSPGTYEHLAPALVLVGQRGLRFEVAPPGQAPFHVLLLDRAGG